MEAKHNKLDTSCSVHWTLTDTFQLYPRAWRRIRRSKSGTIESVHWTCTVESFQRSNKPRWKLGSSWILG
ncbi:unnamed protein product [Nezara viridula]|uniref:Uncharacterized protein n=1 Tax=Nezara viridula TaxID=85310 RepID=A0A9P0HGK8_NEZVI|nr:unnamed protein product [Nezara viridula]